MMMAAFHLQQKAPPKEGDFEFLPKLVMPNHTTTLWVRRSLGNFLWALSHLEALIQQHTLRFGTEQKIILTYNWIQDNLDKLTFSEISQTPIHLAMDIELKEKYCQARGYQAENKKIYTVYEAEMPIAIEAYKEYYNLKEFFVKDKPVPLRWTSPSKIPSWFTNFGIEK